MAPKTAPKTALKQVRTDLDSGDFEQAAFKASELCRDDPKNYNAHVFLGLALHKLNDYNGSEKAYTTATKLNNDNKIAWQGLISLYESQGSGKLEAYHKTLIQLCHVFAKTDEIDKAQAAMTKYLQFVKVHGSKFAYILALFLKLPSSPVYDSLDKAGEHPSQTYLYIAELAEAEEKEFINREIGERRTRLGARLGEVTLEVKLEAFTRGVLDTLYQGIIDWTNDDQIRRTYEEKLLQRTYDHLCSLPASRKSEHRDTVYNAARGMVIIKHPFELAWKIVIDWNDVVCLSDMDFTLLRDFIELFPDNGVTKLLKGIMATNLSPFPQNNMSAEQETVVDSANNISQPIQEDHLLLMTEGLDQSPSSILAHRIMAEVYLQLEEFQSSVNVSRNALALVSKTQRNTGLSLSNTSDALNVTLATSLVTFQSPKNHPEARELFQTVLSHKPNEMNCLLGLGLILEEDQDYTAATEMLSHALAHNINDVRVRSEYFWCKGQDGDLETALKGLQDTLPMVESASSLWHNMKAEILYRIGYCQWELDQSDAARKNRNGAYANFLACIQTDMNYAPAYSSLGIYYADYKKDRKRARRCFHKAVELSASEILAAERLARDFAEQGEWDLVEVIAKRVVDSGKAKPAPGSKRKGHSWPFAVLGVVEINKQHYPKSIVSFQAALRISPNDYQCWVGLGESYYNSGRYTAAIKAFQNAETLESTLSEPEKSNIWFSKYMMANVVRDLGDYDGAIVLYEKVLEIKNDEFGVSIALLQTVIENSWKAIESGLFGEAVEAAQRAIKMGLSLATHRTNSFNLWKSIGDGFCTFSWIKIRTSELPIELFTSTLKSLCDSTAFKVLSEVDDIGENYQTILEDAQAQDRFSQLSPVYAAILAYKYALYSTVNDVHAQAVAWYNLGWAEYRAYTSKTRISGQTTKKTRVRGFLKAAIRCFKRAIELEAGNAEFWNAFGIATVALEPKMAQHAFVRSLHLDERNASVWTNLGALYLSHNDYELANKAFTRAQSTDPDHANAWLGQGLLALIIGEPSEAQELIAHAFGLGNASVISPKHHYSLTAFDRTSQQTSVEPLDLLQPLFALHQLRCMEPSELLYQHLSALFAERIGDLPSAKENLDVVCTGVEAEYETDESISALLKYAQVASDRARIQLGASEYEAAVESAETAINLTSDEGIEEVDSKLYQAVRLSAHLTAGLSQYYLKHMDAAIEMFRDALQEADNSPDIVCLLAQVLWAKGGEEEKLVAREQLYECVEKHPDHVEAVILLGVIAVLDMDEDAIAAVESDLQSMRTRNDLDIQSLGKIVKLVAAIPALKPGTGATAHTSDRVQQASSSIMISPSQPSGWMELSAAVKVSYPAEMALRTTLQNIPPRGVFSADDLCKAYSLVGTNESVLSAIMVAPWSLAGWSSLNHCLAEIES
ncbi:Superkiller protein 3 [Myotisia sp. PD_48]|nr:Superkiller protein 3 [Myotisia sp. PD_48]